MAASEQKPRSMLSGSSSIPSLPDVHRKPSGAQWSFLQTLLTQDQQPQADPGFFHPQNTSGGSSTSDVNTAHDGPEVDPSSTDESDKLTTDETVTARADKILTASWSSTMAGTPEQARRGERRRHSRESASSVRQHSGSVSKKKFKPRTGHDFKQGDVSRRRYSSPAAATNTGSAKLLETRLKQDNDSATRKPATSIDSVTSEKFASNTTEDGGESSQRSGLDKQATTHTPSVVDVVNTDTDKTLTTDSLHGSQRVTELGLVSSLASMSSLQDKNSSTEAGPQAPTPSDPINQWTTCRALDGSGDDDSEDDDEDDDDGLGQSRATESWLHKSHDGPDGFYSRANSSTGARRKRPLLLPPIMLPPVYTMKPTPLKLRDDMYFATAGPRARMSLNEDEWEKLRDCRYLRILNMRRPIKV